MKTIIYSITFLLITFLCSCEDDFLDLQPLDKYTEEVYFKEPAHFMSAANQFYSRMYGWDQMHDLCDFGSDLVAYPQDYGRGIINVENSDKYWNNAYVFIRENNILLEKVNEYSGDLSEIEQYIAEAKFFRAWNHYFLVERFGGVPIVVDVLDLDSPELYGKRNSRYEVVSQVIKDLNEAIENLPLEQNIPADQKGRVSKWTAMAFKARVLLHEATWMKYAGKTTDGDGVISGAGSEGYDANNIEKYLQEALSISKEIMDNGGYKLWSYNQELNNQTMYYLFCLEDAGSNPAGLDKGSNSEFMLFSKYDFDLRQGDAQVSHTVEKRLQPNRKFMDMFLCTDGLPIKQSTLFKGYQTTSTEYNNRDYRLLSYFGDLNTGEIPAEGSIKLISGEVGYSCRKFRAYNYGSYRGARQESADFSFIRLAEVYLIYAESIVELRGELTDEELDISINKLRSRAGIANLSNDFISSNKLDFKEEIRRERAIELFGENSRFKDLRRWGIAEEELNKDICASVIEGTDYEDNESLYNPSDYPYGEISVDTGVGVRKALLIDPAQNRSFERNHYLRPIPMTEIQLNNSLLQNPGF